MKKLLALLLVFLMLVSAFTGCSKNENVSSEPEDTTADVSSEPEEDVSSEPEEEVSSEPEEEEEEPSYEYEEPEEEEEEPAKPLSPAQQRFENMLEGKDKQFNEDTLYSEGNLGRLAKAVKKAKSGKTAKFVFYGNGSNTANNHEYAAVGSDYVELFEEWFTVNYGPCEVYKQGSDGLQSSTALLKVEHDVLRFEPDVVFLDFAVQDNLANSAGNAMAYDKIIRRILESKSSPAVVALMLTGAEQSSYSQNPQNSNPFASASSAQKVIAKYYNIPVVDFEYAVWENMPELVEETTKTEIPLLSWKNIAKYNIMLNDDGHKILSGAVTNLINVVNSKLNKVLAEKEYVYPSEGYYPDKTNEYKAYSFINVGDIADKKLKGYSFDIDVYDNDFDYRLIRKNDDNGLTPYIRTMKHYIAAEDASQALKDAEVNPHYLALTLPEVKEDTYFIFFTTTAVGKSTFTTDSNFASKYFPISMVCTTAEGEKVVKLPSADYGAYKAAPNMGNTAKLLIPKGTTKIEFRIYDKNGAVCLLGIAHK